MYRMYERLVSVIARNALERRYIKTVYALNHLPSVLILSILEFAYRPSERYGRRPFYYELIFNFRSFRYLGEL